MLERCISLGGGLRKPPSSLSPGRLKRPRPLSHYSTAYQEQQHGHQQQQAPPSSVPVTIVGAGPAGLTLSALLSKFGVPSVLLERAAALPTHPQAHFINLRSMEIMRHAFDGLDRTVLEMSPPQEEWRDFVVCSTVLGRQLARVDNFCGGEADRRALSPTSVAHLSQNVLLPLLLEEAERAMADCCPSAQIVFGAEVAGLRRLNGSERSSTQGLGPDDSSRHQLSLSHPRLEVSVRRKRGSRGNATVEPIAPNGGTTPESSTISCRYVVAADGAGSSVRAAAGVELSGRRDLGHLVNIHFTCRELADLLLPEKHMQGKKPRPGMLYFVYNEETICVLVAHNVQKGEWACQVPFFPPHQTAEFFTRERSLSIIREALGPGSSRLSINICSVRPWTMNALVADDYFSDGVFARGGRGVACKEEGGEGGGGGGGSGVFLVGDAAHQFPPAGGFGLNTGVQDAHNLAWKLAAVHHGLASPDLLLSYEQERRPVAMRNAALSVRNLKRSLRVLETLGVDPKLGASTDLMGQLVRLPLTMNWSGSMSGIAASLLPTDKKNTPVSEEEKARRQRSSEERSAEQILRLGRRQLQSLREEGHPFGDSRVRALRRLLSEGGGLPLLFPEHDVGFSYRTSASAPSFPSSSSPGAALRLGGRMPHFVLEAPPPLHRDVDAHDQAVSCSNNGGEPGRGVGKDGRPPSAPSLSTVDLPDQLRELLLDCFDSRRLELSAAAVAADFPESDDHFHSSSTAPAGDNSFTPTDREVSTASGSVAEGGKGAVATEAHRSSAGARARASMASVLIVSPRPPARARSSTSTNRSALRRSGGGDESGDDTVDAAEATEAFSKRWIHAAVVAQRRRQDLRGEGEIQAATVSDKGEEKDDILHSPPIVVLTVSPPAHGATTVDGSSSDHSSSNSTNTDMTMPVPSSVAHLEAYLDHSCGITATKSPLGKATAKTAVTRCATVRAGSLVDGVDRRRSSDDGILAKDGEELEVGGTGKAAANTSHEDRVNVQQAGPCVLSMRAVDGSSAGNLGEAFAAAGAEAVLLRPDGHIAWLAPRRDLDEVGKKCPRAGSDPDYVETEIGGCEREDPALVAELGRALDRVYMWDRTQM